MVIITKDYNNRKGNRFCEEFDATAKNCDINFMLAGVVLQKKIKAALNMPEAHDKKEDYARAIVGACKNTPAGSGNPVNAWFFPPTPPPPAPPPPATFAIPLDNVLLDIAAYSAAQAAVVAGTGTVEARLGTEITMMNDLESLKNDVQRVMNKNYASAEEICKSAKLDIKKSPTSKKKAFSVTPTTVSGQLAFSVFVKPLLIEGVTKAESVHYRQSPNGSTNWTDIADTYGAKAKMTKGGFTPKSTMFFSAQLIFTKGRVSIIVYSGPVDVK